MHQLQRSNNVRNIVNSSDALLGVLSRRCEKFRVVQFAVDFASTISDVIRNYAFWILAGITIHWRRLHSPIPADDFNRCRPASAAVAR